MRVEFTARALADLERLHAFLAGKSPAAAARIIDQIMDALESLTDMPQRCPLLDPEDEHGIRRMVIDAGSGYVATFDLPQSPARVRILVIRASREAGF